MITNDTSVTTLAKQMRAGMILKSRDNGTSFYSVADGVDHDWILDIIHKVHGDTFPYDTLYAMAFHAADLLADADEDVDLQELLRGEEAPVYTSTLTAWLAEHNDHLHYCDEAAKDFGLDADASLETRIQYGWSYLWDQTSSTVLFELEKLAEAASS